METEMAGRRYLLPGVADNKTDWNLLGTPRVALKAKQRFLLLIGRLIGRQRRNKVLSPRHYESKPTSDWNEVYRR